MKTVDCQALFNTFWSFQVEWGARVGVDVADYRMFCSIHHTAPWDHDVPTIKAEKPDSPWLHTETAKNTKVLHCFLIFTFYPHCLVLVGSRKKEKGFGWFCKQKCFYLILYIIYRYMYIRLNINRNNDSREAKLTLVGWLEIWIQQFHVRFVALSAEMARGSIPHIK